MYVIHDTILEKNYIIFGFLPDAINSKIVRV